MSEHSQNSAVTYFYRDASNYKFWYTVVVEGALALDELKPHLIDLEFFIPERIGLPRLVPASMNSDDHDLHEFFSITPIGDDQVFCSSSEFLRRVRLANKCGWFYAGI